VRPGRETRLTIRKANDVERARRVVRAFAFEAGLKPSEAEELVLATSELATNLVKHATKGGSLTCRLLGGEGGLEVEVIAEDTGPGIADIQRALEDGFSTAASLGSGLPAARRLSDTFDIVTGPAGTTVRLTKRPARA
jgi:serine/threonine-protein kinase RsbT